MATSLAFNLHIYVKIPVFFKAHFFQIDHNMDFNEKH